MKCECEVDVIDVQSKMAFPALPAAEDWSEFPTSERVPEVREDGFSRGD